MSSQIKYSSNLLCTLHNSITERELQLIIINRFCEYFLDYCYIYLKRHKLFDFSPLPFSLSRFLICFCAEVSFSRSCLQSVRKTNDTRTSVLRIVAANVCLVSASILHDLSDMQPQINAIKIEHPPYYCSSYTPPSAATTADHVQATASFSEFQNLLCSYF